MANGEWAYTLYDPVIGDNAEAQIDVPYAGLYVFGVTAYNSEGASVTIENDPPVWIGLDTPSYPENIVLTVTDNQTTNLSWTPPSVGAHGAYFDGLVNSYKIVRADGAEYTVEGDVLSFTEELTIPGTYNYNVSCVNTSGEGDADASNTGAYYFDGFLLAEDFWVSVPALDWQLEGENTDMWFHWPTEYAGGNTWEMIYYSDQNNTFDGIARSVSPIVNTSGLNALTLKFRQSQRWLSGSYTFKLQTSSDGGSSWTDAWSITVDESTENNSELVVIDNADVGSENFQFSFVFEGESANLDFLTVDDVWLYEASEVDLVAMEIVIPELIQPDDVITPEANIESWGSLETEFTATMSFMQGSNVIYSSEVTATIPGGADMSLTFEDWTAIEGNYQVELSVVANNDENPDNNTIYDNFNVYYLNAERTLVVCEEATGTWCGYCPSAATGLDDLVQNNWPVAVIAYHSNDDYETTEGRDRIDYYEVDGYPTVVFDGVIVYVGSDGSESMYDAYLPVVEQRLSIPAAVSIEINNVFLYENHLHADILVESGSPIDADNVALIATVTESDIPENWAGMNEVDYVERNMYQGANGANLDLTDQIEEVHISIEIDPSWVTANSELVVFVQNLDDKEIYNGNKVDLLMVSVDEMEKWVAVYPNPASDFITISGCEACELNIYNLNGQKVLSENIPANKAQVNVSELSFGSYVLELVVDGKTFSKKILIK